MFWGVGGGRFFVQVCCWLFAVYIVEIAYFQLDEESQSLRYFSSFDFGRIFRLPWHPCSTCDIS